MRHWVVTYSPIPSADALLRYQSLSDMCLVMPHVDHSSGVQAKECIVYVVVRFSSSRCMKTEKRDYHFDACVIFDALEIQTFKILHRQWTFLGDDGWCCYNPYIHPSLLIMGDYWECSDWYMSISGVNMPSQRTLITPSSDSSTRWHKLIRHFPHFSCVSADCRMLDPNRHANWANQIEQTEGRERVSPSSFREQGPGWQSWVDPVLPSRCVIPWCCDLRGGPAVAGS